MMTAAKLEYWIHGNGLSKAVLPHGVLGDDMPGHGENSWDQTTYDLSSLVHYYTKLIPHGAHVVGHSLGGHIALNVALVRPDITVTAMGMVPSKSFDDALKAFKPQEEFQHFCSPERTYQDFVNLAKLYTHDLSHQSSFIDAMMKQDPIFPSTLLSQGFNQYDWQEVDKAKELKDRFELIVNDLDPLINEQVAWKLPLNIINQSIFGHCPWVPQTLYQYTRSSEMPTTLGSPL